MPIVEMYKLGFSEVICMESHWKKMIAPIIVSAIIRLVTLVGGAGTGKTLLALAEGDNRG